MSESINLNMAMLFAAGLGTRLKPFTNNHPKALAIVNGKTLLQRNIEYLQQFGIKKVVVNVHHFSEQIIDIVEKNKGWGSEIIISDESNKILETGGGLLNARNLFQDVENIILMNVDILTNLNLDKMFLFHQTKQSLVTLAVTKRNTSRYFIFNKENELKGWMNTTTNELKGIEQFDESTFQLLAFSGIHIINKKLFSLIKQTGKFSLVDVYLNLMKENKILAYNHQGDKFIDVGKPESIVLAEKIFV